MFLSALAFLAGHGVIHGLVALPSATAWAGVGAAIVISLGIALVGARRSWSEHVLFFARISLMFALGFALAGWRAESRLSERWPESQSGIEVELQGIIASIVDRREDGVRFLLDVSSSSASAPRHVELSWYDTEIAPSPGELWQLRVRLRSPRGFANPGGYDFEAQLLRENTGATGYVRNASINQRLLPASGYPVLRTRAAIAARLERALPNSSMLGIVQGLTVGDTSRMTAPQWRVFANTGTTHLMAISGMHIGMVALWIAWLAGRLLRFVPLQQTRVSSISIQAGVGILTAVTYSALAGFSVPTQRTLIMLCVYFGARLLRREMAPTHGLGLALIGVLLVDPFAPLAAGFWLSFGAVGAIFLATSGAIIMESKWRQYGRLQWIATIGLTPLVIGTFGSISLISPLVNLLAIPFFTLFIVPLVLTATALLFINDWLGTFALHFAVRLLDWCWPALEWASRLPLAMWSLPDAPSWAFVLMLVGTVLLLAPGLYATRIAGVLLCCPLLLWKSPRPKTGEFELAVLDVGQGLSVVVTTETHVLVYDMGPSFRSGRDAGELVVVPFLRARGVTHVDTAMASHGDSDHVGGLPSVIAAMSTGRLLFGPSVTPLAGSDVCAAGQVWQWDDVRFEVLYPPAVSVFAEPFMQKRNDSSCVLRIAGAGGSALLFGDIERKSEEWLVAHRALHRVDIAVIPHHGSRTSSSGPVVEAAAARYAVVSAGFGNQWGFPKVDVLDRWQSTGAIPLQTARSGAIEFEVSREGVRPPHLYRETHRKYWSN